ncbi:phosphatase PAP2 family protein [Massilia genomosp. 1]|uniref:Phosphatase PAP2 family protein n=1 Tax=Massilia genomosp. 1 TaxID=2609280 RepID=A0ABX0N233_9BURK|nr:phosphatase PAP2 family protein [Massilia genomosp. 1]NHZ66423.1 phosphatase PAP2 family protein [Massilia genomosp. 1]
MSRKRLVLALAGSALAIGWINAFTDLDLILAQAMFDPASGTFPWRHAWFAETVSHVWAKAALLTLAGGMVLTALFDLLWPRAAWTTPFRLRLRVVALSALLAPSWISALKYMSTSHCPWDLALFGGSETYVRLFQSALPYASLGHCMPAGHASSALWLVSLAVFWLPHRPRTALRVGAAMLGLGFALGWMQQLRGAHFLTHTLWSMWWTCLIVSLLYLFLTERKCLLGRPAPVHLS